MTAIETPGPVPGTPEWHAERKTVIGASDSYGAIGLLSGAGEPYFEKTPLKVYDDKVSPIALGDETPAMRNGRILEEGVAQIYAEIRGVTLRVPVKMRRDKEHPFLAANLDRTVVPRSGRERRLLEIKTSSREHWKDKEGNIVDGWGPDGSGESGVPACYFTQVQHQLMVTGYDVADVVVMLKPSDVRIYEILPNPDFIEAMRQKEVKFWRDHVLQRIPPDPTKWDWVYAYKPDDGSTLTLAEDDLNLFAARSLSKIKARIKELKAQEQAITDGLKEFMGAHRYLAGPDGVWVDLLTIDPKTPRLDLEKIRKTAPDLWAKLVEDFGVKSKPYRQLRLKKKPVEETNDDG